MIREIFFPTNPSTSALLNASIFSNSIRTLKISLFRSCNRPKKIKKWEFCTQNLEIQYDPIKIWKEFDFISTKSKAAKRPLSRLSPTDGPHRTPVTDGKSRPDRNSRNLIRSRDGTRKRKLQRFKSRVKLQKTCNFPPDSSGNGSEISKRSGSNRESDFLIYQKDLQIRALADQKGSNSKEKR